MNIESGDLQNLLHAQARSHMPLGVADNYRYWGDETVFIDTMNGPYITDVTGKQYVDFRLAYGPIILGYRDTRIDEEVVNCIRNRGSMCGFSTGLESEVAELMKAMCPNLELVRFSNSGTEAVIGASRTARGFTGREKIVVVEGSFHGLHDEMMWKSDVEGWSPEQVEAPQIKAFGAGVSSNTRSSIEVISLNDVQALRNIFAQQGDDIAAVIIEPIMGNCGSIAATQDYVQALRDTCNSHGALLIFDEVKTGFRVAQGGAQELYGIQADLATYAKAMGNGYPVAAFGGRADVMSRIDINENGVVHGGTYTANLLAMSAAKATLTVLKDTEAVSTIDSVGKAIQQRLSNVFSRFGVEHSFAGPAAMFGVHFASDVPQNYRDWRSSDSQLYQSFAFGLIERGLMLEPDSREPWFICEAHDQLDLDWLETIASEAMDAALSKQNSP
ncbi:MAG: aminotransferase class III-fold pyridoxal phosphate-dependent enzyme [Pseudophaeobacter sp.]|uniref:aspartate aminotransferase family protein n=1 Tax=Pseudophaeobacter sp. TaxID=1971739 RepID=UPI003296EE8A